MDGMNTQLLPTTADEHSLLVDPAALPPIIAGSTTPTVQKRVRLFYLSVADLFERWIARRLLLEEAERDCIDG